VPTAVTDRCSKASDRPYDRSLTRSHYIGCSISIYWFIPFFRIFQLIIKHYHPMNLLPSLASTSNYNIANLLSKPLSHHRFDSLIGGLHSPNPTTSADTATVDTVPTVAVVAIPATVDSLATAVASISDSVLALLTHPNPVPYFVDTGASLPVTPLCSDFLSLLQAPYGLIRSASTSVASVSKPPVDPYTLIPGEDVSVDPADPIEFLSLDLFALNSKSVDHFDIWEFGTATLVFISNSELTTILVEPTLDWTDWFDWIPLPRLTPTESYYHIFGLNYSQAFALLHLIPIWIALVSALIRSE